VTKWRASAWEKDSRISSSNVTKSQFTCTDFYHPVDLHHPLQCQDFIFEFQAFEVVHVRSGSQSWVTRCLLPVSWPYSGLNFMGRMFSEGKKLPNFSLDMLKLRPLNRIEILGNKRPVGIAVSCKNDSTNCISIIGWLVITGGGGS